MPRTFPIKICPTCGDVNFKSTSRSRAVSNSYKCLSCGYYGIFPEILFSSIEEMKKYIEEQEKRVNLELKKRKYQPRTTTVQRDPYAIITILILFLFMILAIIMIVSSRF